MLIGYIVGLSLAPVTKGGVFIAITSLVGICIINALVLFLWYFDFIAYADFASKYFSFLIPLTTLLLVPVGLMVAVFTISIGRARDGRLVLFRSETIASIAVVIALPAFFYVNAT